MVEGKKRLPRQNVTLWSCEHLVPSNNYVCHAYESRNSPKTLCTLFIKHIPSWPQCMIMFAASSCHKKFLTRWVKVARWRKGWDARSLSCVLWAGGVAHSQWAQSEEITQSCECCLVTLMISSWLSKRITLCKQYNGDSLEQRDLDIVWPSRLSALIWDNGSSSDGLFPVRHQNEYHALKCLCVHKHLEFTIYD